MRTTFEFASRLSFINAPKSKKSLESFLTDVHEFKNGSTDILQWQLDMGLPGELFSPAAPPPRQQTDFDHADMWDEADDQGEPEGDKHLLYLDNIAEQIRLRDVSMRKNSSNSLAEIKPRRP